MMQGIAVCVVAAAVVVAARVPVARAAVAADEVTALPGWGKALPSKQYSGYLSVGSDRHYHYWFVEAEGDPATAPVMLWLNGGPGCSSLDGYLYEHGPFHVSEEDHTQLYYNNYTWAHDVNMLYLESPAGVGFSYSTSKKYVFNDTATANDNFEALVAFFKGFSEYASNDFYITGESYAGVYVPTLAARVLAGNKASESNIPLKGIMVGNGCTGNDVGICGGKGTKFEKDALAGHALVDPVLSEQLDKACGDYLNPSAQCEELLNKMSAAVGNVNVYDIYTPCINGDFSDVSRAPGARTVGGPAECIDGIAAGAYLNTDVVQKALHVDAGRSYFGRWTICSSKVDYTPTASDLPKNVYPDLVKAIRVLIYNGDADLCVPYLDNESWTRGMGFPVAKEWHPWSLNQQVAGYAIEYTVPDGPYPFYMVTVKGAGHMVPQYRPPQALEMMRRYVAQQPF